MFISKAKLQDLEERVCDLEFGNTTLKAELERVRDTVTGDRGRQIETARTLRQLLILLGVDHVPAQGPGLVKKGGPEHG